MKIQFIVNIYMAEHFFNYIEPEKINELNLEFDAPVQTEKGTFVSKLKNPVQFYFPKSEILGIFEDKLKSVSIKYLIDDEDNYEFLNFLDNLDSFCVNASSKNSTKWFNGNQISEEKLANRYIRLYNVEDDDESNSENENDDDDSNDNANSEILVININVDKQNKDLMDNVYKYNDDDDLDLIVEFTGIEFYRGDFKWNLSLKDIFHVENSSSEEEDNFDFNSMIKPVENDKISETEINELANTDSLENDLNKNTVIELESIISNKKLEKKKYLVNAERAKEAADDLKSEAEKVEEEISHYTDRLKEISESR